MRRKEAQSKQAAALLAGSLDRKQAENAVEDTTVRTAEREWKYAGDEDSGGSEDVT
jgi:hypothetical protein